MTDQTLSPYRSTSRKPPITTKSQAMSKYQNDILTGEMPANGSLKKGHPNRRDDAEQILKTINKLHHDEKYNFEVVGYLGHGGFSNVYKVKLDLDKTVALAKQTTMRRKSRFPGSGPTSDELAHGAQAIEEDIYDNPGTSDNDRTNDGTNDGTNKEEENEPKNVFERSRTLKKEKFYAAKVNRKLYDETQAVYQKRCDSEYSIMNELKACVNICKAVHHYPAVIL